MDQMGTIYIEPGPYFNGDFQIEAVSGGNVIYNIDQPTRVASVIPYDYFPSRVEFTAADIIAAAPETVSGIVSCNFNCTIGVSNS